MQITRSKMRFLVGIERSLRYMITAERSAEGGAPGRETSNDEPQPGVGTDHAACGCPGAQRADQLRGKA
jgi:hypothetical protein